MDKHSHLLNYPVIIMLNPAVGAWFGASLTTGFFLVEPRVPCGYAIHAVFPGAEPRGVWASVSRLNADFNALC
ncbi:MAG: hypothetical protein OHK0041_22050 [Anaerolineales bacterium]